MAGVQRPRLFSLRAPGTGRPRYQGSSNNSILIYISIPFYIVPLWGEVCILATPRGLNTLFTQDAFPIAY